MQYFSTNQFELRIHNDSDVISLNVFLLSDISLQYKLLRIKKTTLTASCKNLDSISVVTSTKVADFFRQVS